jgi:ABC-type sugar transport system substrate-binding protein
MRFCHTLLMLAGLILLAGCTKDGGAPAASASPQTSAASGGAKKPRVAGIIFQEDQYFRLALFGMRDAAKKAGIELLEANSNNKPEKEIELINTYATQGVDAIVVSPLSKKGSEAALRQAQNKGIKVVTHSTALEADLAAAHVECSPADLGDQTGKAARKYIEEKLGGKAKIAILAYKSLVPEQSDARVNGFKKNVASLPGVQIVAEQDAWLAENAVKKAGDILTANPDINIIYAANEGGTIGSVLAVKNAGKTGKVVVFGTDVSEQLLGFLKSPDNILQATTAQLPVEVGRQAVEAALKTLKGEAVEKKAYLKGVPLTRADLAGVEIYEKQLKEWMGGGK